MNTTATKRSSSKKPPAARPGLAGEIGKSGAFSSPEHEAMLNIVRTTALLNEPFEQLFRTHGVSGPLFNILRIVKGRTSGRARSASGGVPLGEIGPQMISPAPDVTRLVDRLEKLGLAERRRSEADRRVVLVRLLPKGRRLIEKINPSLEALHKQTLKHMTRRELESISTLMTKARRAVGGGDKSDDPSGDCG